MIYLIISIICSVSVGVLLKLYRRYDINIYQAINWNYVAALILSWYYFNPQVDFTVEQPVNLYLTLGILLPLLFWILNQSLKTQGLARTDIAQRLSLIIPLTAAWLLFNEEITLFKWIGLLIGLIGVILVLRKAQSANHNNHYIYPVLVFIGYGIVDILFKTVAKNTSIPYPTALFQIFLIACLITLLFLTIQFLRKKQAFQLHAIIPGLVLGMFNFGNIYSYLKAHQHYSNNPSTVFAAMNLGVILLGSLLGIMVFREKFKALNYLGFILVIIAVIFIAIAQKYAI